jgi:hypothetical protein
MSIKHDPKFEENALAALKSAFRGVSPDASLRLAKRLQAFQLKLQNPRKLRPNAS